MPDPAVLYGCLLGTALGDSLGLPMEGLPPGRATRMFPGPLRQRLLAGRGVVSDDTAQTVFVLQSLWECGGDPDRFARLLARRIRRWFLAIPPGIGLSTARACLRLCRGVPPHRSGVPSAGNGAAMRSAVIGAFFATDADARIRFSDAAARVTHTDPRAVTGARLVALAAACAAGGTPDAYPQRAAELAPDWAAVAVDAAGPRGVSGYVCATAPAAIGCWQRSPGSLAAVVSDAIALGGDTDTVAAIAGGIAGCAPDRGPVPDHWMHWVGWPSAGHLERLSRGPLPDPPWLALAGMHALTLPVVLAHGFRRLLPPY